MLKKHLLEVIKSWVWMFLNDKVLSALVLKLLSNDRAIHFHLSFPFESGSGKQKTHAVALRPFKTFHTQTPTRTEHIPICVINLYFNLQILETPQNSSHKSRFRCNILNPESIPVNFSAS